jgi:hypothetical protein
MKLFDRHLEGNQQQYDKEAIAVNSITRPIEVRFASASVSGSRFKNVVSCLGW